MRIKSPFDVGDVAKISKHGSGHPVGTQCTVTAIGYDEEHGSKGRSAWRVKTTLDKSRDWWSAGWFAKVSPKDKKKGN